MGAVRKLKRATELAEVEDVLKRSEVFKEMQETQAKMARNAVRAQYLLVKYHEHFLTPKTVWDLVDARLAEESRRLEKLRDDAVRILSLLVEEGVISRERLNEAIDGNLLPRLRARE